MNASFFRTLVLGGLAGAGAFGVAVSVLTACESLDETSPLPSPDASDLDAGAPPPEPEEASTSSSSTSSGSGGPDPLPSGRIRVANLLQGSQPVDLCVRAGSGAFGGGWISGTADGFSGATGYTGKRDGLAYGEISQHAFVAVPTPGAAGVSFTFRVVALGSPCDGAGAVIYGTSPPTVIRQDGAVTIYVYGSIEDGVDAGDANPRVAVMSDNRTPPATATQFRVVHGVADVSAFDVVINGETVLQGIRYGTPFSGPPYATISSTSPPPPGFTNIPAGIPEDATMTLRAGTTARSFTIPSRLRRGIASTVFASGESGKLLVQLCSDRTPETGELASCVKLTAQ